MRNFSLIGIALLGLSLFCSSARAGGVSPSTGAPISGAGCITVGSSILKGDSLGGCANATSAVDYAPATSGSSILKGNGSGGFSNAVSATDYAPATSGSSILKGNGAGAFANAVSSTDYAPATSGSAILKGNGTGGFASAASGTDYAPATSGSSVLLGNGAGGFSSLAGNTLAAHNFGNQISAAGAIVGAQPACGDLSNGAASCSTDTTNASNISSGTLGAARLPNPSATTLGGIQSAIPQSNKWINSISTSGVPSFTQPASTNLSDIPLPFASGGTADTYGPSAVFQQKTNANPGTTTNKLYTTDASGNAVNIAAGATGKVYGICDNGCGNGGTGTFLTGPSDHSCVFDGGVTRNDYVGISASVAGDCTDVGATPPAGTQVIGYVDQATTGGAATYTVFFYGPDYAGAAGGGGSVNTSYRGSGAGYASTTTIGGSGRCYTNLMAGADFKAQYDACVTALPSGGTIDATGYTPGSTVSWSATLVVGQVSPNNKSWTLLVDNHSIQYQCNVNNVAQDCVDLNPGSSIIDMNNSSIQSGPNGAGDPAGGFAQLGASAHVRDILRTTNQGGGVGGTGGALRGLVMGCGSGVLADGGAVLHLIGVQQSMTIDSLEAGGCTGSAAKLYLVLIDGSASFGLTGVSFVGNGTLNCNGNAFCVPLRIQTTNNSVNTVSFNGYQFQHEGTGQCEVEIQPTSGRIVNISFFNNVIESTHSNANGFCIDASAQSVGSIIIENTGISQAAASGTDIVHITNAANLDDFRFIDAFHVNSWTNWVTNSTSGKTISSQTGGTVFREYSYYRTTGGVVARSEIRDTSTGVFYDMSPNNGGVLKTGSFGVLQQYASGTIPTCAAALANTFTCVSDATLCSNGTTYTGGGTTGCLLECNNAGSAWKESGVPCQ